MPFLQKAVPLILYFMGHSEIIDCVKHIKIIGIGADGCSLASHVLSNTPHVRVVFLSDKSSLSISPEYKNEETLAQTLNDTYLLFIATNITDEANQLNVERLVHAAREKGVLVLGVALPCAPEATQQMLQTWSTHVDALLVGEPEQLHMHLRNAVHEVAEIINEYGHVNVDFEDVRYILSMRGVARIGTSTAEGNNRAQRAALSAIQDLNLDQSQGLLIILSAAKGFLKLAESRQVMHTINTYLPKSADVIFGAAYDDSLGDQLRVTVLVSGLPYASSALE